MENNRQTYSKEIRFCFMGVAMIMIVLFHVSQTLNSDDVVGKILNYVFGEGWLGVDVFFLLSSFGLCYSYNNNSLLHFYKRRFFRLFPLYPLALIIGILGNNMDISHALWTFLCQLTGIALFSPVVDLLWFLEALVLLYLFFPLFYKLCEFVHSRGIWCFLLVCVFTSLSLIFINNYWIQISIKRIPVMMLGVLTFLCDKNNLETKKFKYYGFMCLLAMIPLMKSMHFYVPACMLLISITISCFHIPKTLCFLGKHTLEIYIAQHFSLLVFTVFSEQNSIVQISIYVITVMLMSIVFCYVDKFKIFFIEK